MRIGRDHIVLLIAQVNIARFETPEDVFEHAHALDRSSMVYDDLRI